MTKKKVDLSRVARWGGTGQLAPSRYALTTCDACTGVHFELMDKDGDVFCVVLFEAEHLLEMSAAFAEAAKIMEERGAIPGKQ